MATSFILMMALGLASQVAKSQGFVHNQMKSFSVENCPIRNVTTTIIESINNSTKIILDETAAAPEEHRCGIIRQII